jgi:hypothetical protein
MLGEAGLLASDAVRASWAVYEAIPMLGEVGLLAGDAVRASWAVHEAIPTLLSLCDACCVPIPRGVLQSARLQVRAWLLTMVPQYTATPDCRFFSSLDCRGLVSSDRSKTYIGYRRIREVPPICFGACTAF